MSGGRQFNMISPAIWRSARFLAQDSDARVLQFYFMTSEHQSSAGCYRVPDGYVCADLGWSIDQYQTARSALRDGSLILFDDETSEVYVLRCSSTAVRRTTSMLKARHVGSAKLRAIPFASRLKPISKRLKASGNQSPRIRRKRADEHPFHDEGRCPMIPYRYRMPWVWIYRYLDQDLNRDQKPRPKPNQNREKDLRASIFERRGSRPVARALEGRGSAKRWRPLTGPLALSTAVAPFEDDNAMCRGQVR